MIFEIPLEHFPQPFAKMISINNEKCQSNFIKCTGNQILLKMRKSLSFDYHQPSKTLHDPSYNEALKPSKYTETRRKLFAEKYHTNNFSFEFNTNTTLSSLKQSFCQSITDLKSQIFPSTNEASIKNFYF
uniref:Uncharacterized protein n=1 Tax=Strongyloides stercoralis TaxID=6248 RepID=A0A0K0ETA9_STRER